MVNYLCSSGEILKATYLCSSHSPKGNHASDPHDAIVEIQHPKVAEHEIIIEDDTKEKQKEERKRKLGKHLQDIQEQKKERKKTNSTIIVGRYSLPGCSKHSMGCKWNFNIPNKIQ